MLRDAAAAAKREPIGYRSPMILWIAATLLSAMSIMCPVAGSEK